MKFDQKKFNIGDEKKEQKSKNLNLENDITKLKDAVSKINEESLSPEQKSNLLKIKEKINKIVKKIIKTVKWTTLVVGILGVGNYERTHSELDKYTNEQGEVVYSHEDQRTTRYLNILAGREKFTESDVRIIFNGFAEDYFSDKDVKFEKNIEDMTIEEIDKIMYIEISKENKKFKLGDFTKSFYVILNQLNRQVDTSAYEFKADAYQLIWKLEEECGNPKIRFVSEDLNSIFSYLRTEAFDRASHEDIVNNIIYIDPLKLFEYFFPEISHMKLHNDRPISSVVQILSDFTGVIKRGGIDAGKLTNEYMKIYDIPGSFEHEVHSIIEPYLTEKYYPLNKK